MIGRTGLAAAVLAWALGTLTLGPLARAEDLSCSLTSIPLVTDFPASDQRAELSAVVVEQDRLITLSNEAIDHKKREHSLQIFRGSVSSGYRFDHDEPIFRAQKGTCAEADFEGLTSGGGYYFAISSHSRLSAKRAKSSWSEKKLLNKLGDESDGVCSSRYQLLKFKLDANGTMRPVQATSLRTLIEGHPVLGPPALLPNKEGGVDIEGLAATADALYVGFRGPVLERNLVPVLKLSHDLDAATSGSTSLRFVMLDGRGIRAMTAGPDGIYILAGPTGKEAQTFVIYRWDGEDQSTTARGPARICNLGLHDASKPEGISFLDKSGGSARFMLVFDGPAPLKAAVATVPAGR